MGAIRSRRRATVLLSSVHFTQHLFRILPAILPVLLLAFPYPLWKLGGLVSVYFLGSGLGQAPIGVLVDRYDRRYVLPPGVALMGIGYLVVGAAPAVAGDQTPVTVIAGEPFAAPFLVIALGTFLSGLGASAIHPAGYPLVIVNAPPGRRGRALGAWASAAKLGDAAAPAAIAVLVLGLAWDEIFRVFGGVGLLYAIGLAAVMSRDWIDTRPASRRGSADRTEPAGGTTVTDHEGPPPAADRATDRRRFAYPILALLVFFVARAVSDKGLLTFLPTFIVAVYGYSFAVGGLVLPPESFADLYFTAVFLVAAGTILLTGRLVDRFDPRAVLIGFFAVAAIALAVLAAGSLSPLALLVTLVILGASNWGWIPARDAIIDDVTPPALEGRTFGSLHTVSHLASAAAPLAIGFVAESHGLRTSFLLVALVILVALGAIASLYSRRVYRPQTDTSQQLTETK